MTATNRNTKDSDPPPKKTTSCVLNFIVDVNGLLTPCIMFIRACHNACNACIVHRNGLAL